MEPVVQFLLLFNMVNIIMVSWMKSDHTKLKEKHEDTKRRLRSIEKRVRELETNF